MGSIGTCALLCVTSLAAASAVPTSSMTVETFETAAPERLSVQHAGIQRIGGNGVTEGTRALQIDFEPREESTVTLQAPQTWDWSGHGDVNLALDVTNLSKLSTQLYVVLIDERGASQSRATVIPAGTSQTVYAVLNGFVGTVDAGMRETPPAWQSVESKMSWRWGDKKFDLTRVKKIVLATQSLMAPRRLVVDNVRLRVNPPVDPFYLSGLVDEFGQNARLQYPTKIHSLQELQQAARTELAQLANSKGPAGRSRFGGWSEGPKRKATGYFRAEKVDGKWWLIDPEGYLHFSSALANVRMANLDTVTGYDFGSARVRHIDGEELTPEDSADIVPVKGDALNTRFLASPLRRQMFEWLPAYDDPLGEHYGYRRTFHMGPLEHGEIYSFYRANLERRYGESSPGSYMRTWRQVTIDRMRDWGFTSLGNWIDPMFYDNEKVPYFANGWIIGNYKTVSSGSDVWAPMPDPYDPEFVRRARLTIEQVAREVKGSPWCVGVFIDNEKSWGRLDSDRAHFAIALDALSRSAADSPAKARFVSILQARYPQVGALNDAWKTDFKSWEQFAATAKVQTITPAMKSDLSQLLFDFSDRYFRVVHDELAKAMPNHMYMGVRMAEWGMPEETIRAAKKYVDVMSFNNYREAMHPDTWGFLKNLDVPTIIGEFHIGSTADTGLYHPGLVHGTNQADRARIYQQYMETVIDNPAMVGAHWFQYIDDPVTGRAYDGENYNVGFVTNTDIPYPEMVEAAKRINYGIYERRHGK
ncbi:hydrolase [Steroidobacter agaridevorans]|uniref:Hydrolase n=2 Tax=Steroidobacterales TaxID=3060226 RepID=A0A829Y8N1_9GAMM|nr:hydrolase [Steroidobacter agaridevorans]GFE87270.1 hydrolase [Steroidobacter agaridevorans]